MFKAILYVQWKWARIAVVMGVILAFLLPVLSVQAVGHPDPTRWDTVELLAAVSLWSVFYPLLAFGLGLILAMVAWAADHSSKHVLSLTLPVPRWHFVLMRFAACSVLLAAPLVAMWIGALLATATAAIPPSLTAYPNALALRFALATLVSFSVFFAISSGTAKTAGWVLGGIGGLVLVQVLFWAGDIQADLLGQLGERIVWRGPLQIFTGKWMLIDV